LLKTGATRYILGEQESTSGWIKADLAKEGILYKNYKLTRKGKVIKESLVGSKKELHFRKIHTMD